MRNGSGLHTLHLRTGLLESRPVGRNLQFDIPGIEFGQQRPLFDAFALRDGDIEHLPRKLEGEVHGVIGRRQPCEVLVDDRRTGCRGDFDGTHGLGHRLAPGASAQEKDYD